MKINSLISKQTTLLLILAISFATLFLPLTSVQAATLKTGMDASDVIGSPRTFTTTAATITSSGFTFPIDTYLDTTNNYLFTMSQISNRVLVFNLNADHTLIDYTADYVLGQTDFTSSSTSTTASTFSKIRSITVDEANQRLYVSDTGSSRVLMFDYSVSFSNGMSASRVLGQANFTASAATATQSGMEEPSSIEYDATNERLFVLDAFGERVLIFDTSDGVTNNEAAINVLGQDDFISNGGTTTQSGISNTEDVSYDSDTSYLYVADPANKRIMVWDLSSVVTNGMDASYVLGQADFTSDTDFGTTQKSVSNLTSVSVDTVNNRLYVGDTNRVLVFDISSGVSNNMDATYVIGQADFVSNSGNRGGSAGANTLFYVFGVDINELDNILYVSDTGNTRVLIFDLSATVSSSPSTGLSYTHPPLCKATITPNTITAGEETTLSWNTTWPTDRQSNYYTKVPGEGLYSSSVNSISIQPKHTTTYRLATFNLWGANFCEATVEVLDTEGEEVTSERNSILTASAAGNSFFRPIISFFAGLFVR